MMFNKPCPQINRKTLIAISPIIFLLLLALWTIVYTSIRPVKAQPFTSTAVAVVKRTNANLREGPGTQYRIVGMSRKGATLPIIGKFDDEFGRRWYKVYLRALGDVWVSGTVVTISAINADIPEASLSQDNGVVNAPVPTDTNSQPPASGGSNGGNSGNNGGNPPPTNPPPQPTAVPQQPATTPDPGA